MSQTIFQSKNILLCKCSGGTPQKINCFELSKLHFNNNYVPNCISAENNFNFFTIKYTYHYYSQQFIISHEHTSFSFISGNKPPICNPNL